MLITDRVSLQFFFIEQSLILKKNPSYFPCLLADTTRSFAVFRLLGRASLDHWSKPSLVNLYFSQCKAYLALCKAWRPFPLHVRALPVCSGWYIRAVFEISMFYVTFKIIENYFQQKKCHNSIIFLKKEICLIYGWVTNIKLSWTY